MQRCSAIVDTSAAAHSVLFVGSVQWYWQLSETVSNLCLLALRQLCGSCLRQFQICVCVYGLVLLLSVSKFSLRQSASIVTKLLSSPAGASCQSGRKMLTAMCSYTEQPRESCTETKQIF